MTNSAVFDTIPARVAPGSAAIPSPQIGVAAPARAGVGNRTVLLYLALTLLALAPGLLLWADVPVGADTMPGLLLQRLKAALEDIRFGAGLRFWLGVTGTTMMGLLLLYPLRKFIAGRRLGSIGAWFHVHILFGLGGPAIILYHCNFGLGSLNANVALWSMLVVAFSGIVGQFVYMRVNAGYFGERQTARQQLDQVIAKVRALDGAQPVSGDFVGRLERFDDLMLTPRRGLWSRVSVRLKVEMRRRGAMAEANHIVREYARANRWSREDHRALQSTIRGALGGYFTTVRSASGRAIREQLWARWRLFHLPVFLVMSVAIVLHVAAVWNMDGPTQAALTTDVDFDETPPAPPVEAKPKAPVAAPKSQNPAKVAVPPRVAAKKPSPKPPVGPVVAQAPAGGSKQAGGPTSIDDILAQPETRTERKVAGAQGDGAATIVQAPNPIVPPAPKLIVAPRPATPPRVATAPPSTPAQQSLPIAEQKPAAPRAVAVVAVTPPKPAPQVVAARETLDKPVVAAVAPKPAPPRAAAGAPPVEINETYAQLEKETAPPPPMALGGAKPKPPVEPRSLAERIADLKAQRFDHNTTRFRLTGRHTKVACENCHRDKLEGTPRACIACHKKDDVHRGRRPSCGSCHSTSTWRK